MENFYPHIFPGNCSIDYVKQPSLYKGGHHLILNHKSTTPIYMQIAVWLETEILKENFKVDEKVYSQYQLAEMFQINPATAAKGLTLLGNEKILYDKRGLGKFVSPDAIEIIKKKRTDNILNNLMEKIVDEAIHLQIDEQQLLNMVSEMYQNRKGE